MASLSPVTAASVLPWVVALPFLGAALPLLLEGRGRSAVAWASALTPGAALGLLCLLGRGVFQGDPLECSWPWVGSLSLEIALRLDGLSLLFAGLILAIGLLVILYARYYLGDSDSLGRFFSLLLVFMGAMLGIALADNLLLLVLFWEVTSLASFLLIGYWQHRPDARAGARMALTVTGLGGLCLLGGTLLLGDIAGTMRISVLNTLGPVIRAHSGYPLALSLVLIGAFTKSAQFPFHFWLPNAMAAPTPVSAYLHSATMVKAGIFLLARLHPALSGTDLWLHLVGGAGLVTLVFGAYEAVFRHDLKGLLAYSTISHLGLIVLLLGLNSPLATVAAVFHLINHATFKASLFMAAGIIDHETGTRDLRRLAGLWRAMPVTGLLAMVAAASMAGVPFLNGFLSKEMLFAESLALSRVGAIGVIVPLGATVAGVFGVAYSTRFIHDVFFNGQPRDLPRSPHEPPRWMRIPVEILVVVCVLVGLAPTLAIGPLLAVAAAPAVGGPLPAYSLAVWHGFNAPLAMSVIALGGGVVCYFWLQTRRNLHGHATGGWTGHRVFEVMLARIDLFASAVTGMMVDGRQQRQAALLLGVALVAVWLPFDHGAEQPALARYTPMNAIAVVGWCVLAAATACAVALHRHRFLALIVTGAVGLVVSAAFAWFSAPDLALTQLVVEVATVLLLLLALPFLGATTPRESGTRRRVRDAVLAVLCGTGLALAAWWMMTRGGGSVSAEHIARSIPEGGGTNVVNVILVDFRGFDTYGEITVLAIAALGIGALLAGEPLLRAREAGAQDVSLGLLSRAIVPLALLVSVHIFLRGHNLPGGGFVAGLVTGVALAMVAVANGRRFADAALRLDGVRTAALGLVVAGATGAGSAMFGRPFLTSTHGHVRLPLVGDLHLASAALFDLGVYLVVVGVVLLILDGFSRLDPAASGVT